jgi:hypothetical protein
MRRGYVLNVSHRTMATFFTEKLYVDINDVAYQQQGASKAKRVRCYLNKADVATSVKTLKSLWDYRESDRELPLDQAIACKARRAADRAPV